jgi:hypothetical protein
MSNKENMRPAFKNDYDALVFLIERYDFKGGWIGAGGMGPEIEVEIQESAPEWAKAIAAEFVGALHSNSHPAMNMAMEVVSCSLQQDRGRLLLIRHWSNPIPQEGPKILQPRVMEKAITKILGVESVYVESDQDRCELRWNSDPESGQFIPDTGDFVLYDSEFKDITCNSKQALEILDALRQPGRTEDKYWSSFSSIDSIHLDFARLDGDYHYCITGTTTPEDITEFCLRSQDSCRP